MSYLPELFEAKDYATAIKVVLICNLTEKPSTMSDIFFVTVESRSGGTWGQGGCLQGLDNMAEGAEGVALASVLCNRGLCYQKMDLHRKALKASLHDFFRLASHLISVYN